MTIVNITAGSWHLVTTTSANTSFQNQSSNDFMYITTESTTNRPITDGVAVPPGSIAILPAGKQVSVCFVKDDNSIHYMEV